MSIFGQVWLWSVAAFALGALLAWALLARPAQARVRELERKLVTAEAAPAATPPRAPEPTRVQPVPAQDDDTAHTRRIQQVRPAPQARPEPEPEPTEYVSPAPAWLERDSLERSAGQGESSRDETVERELAEFDWDSDAESAYEAAAPTGGDGHRQQAQPDTGDDESRYDDTAYDDTAYGETGYGADQHYGNENYGNENYADQNYGDQNYADESDADRTRQDLTAAADPVPERPAAGASLFQPQSYVDNDDARDYDAYDDQPDQQYETTPRTGRHSEESYEPFEPVYVGPDTGEYGGYDDQPDERYQSAEPEEARTETDDDVETETVQGLPKRQRRESPRGGFDAPKPIQPSMRTVSRRDPAPDQGSTHSGSLFEPSVPTGPSAEPAAPVPPPARSHTEPQGAPVPSGPFGPGSAMPLPGGGRPSPDFTVKASVTALRYCIEGSPQFSQMVAEVWFRTPADAERVGFRPLG